MSRARLACGAVALALAAGAAQAERVVVRSGDHDGFTRIVLGFETPPRFDTEPLDGAWRLDPEGPATYDLSDAWRRITRERVAAIEPRPDGALVLRLACDCEVEAFPVGEAMVAIDVADPEPGAEPELQPEPAVVAPAPMALPPVFLPTPTTEAGLPVVTPIPAEPEPEPVPLPAAPDLTALGADLALQLQNGVDRGLLVPAPPLARGDRPTVPTGELRVRAATGVAPEIAAQIGFGDARSEVCPSAEVARLLPGRGGGTHEAIAEARAGLFGELDRIDPGAARALAGELLSAGLGAEAKAILRLVPLGGSDVAALDALATLLDAGPPDASARLLEPWASCEGDAALWAVLALEGRPLPRTLDRGGVVGALSAMPPALRTHLAPRLAGIFLDDGDRATARLVRNAATRDGGEPDRAMRLLSARMTLAEEPSDAAALKELADLVSGRDGVAMEAALRLFSAGGVVPEQALQDAAILVAERRGRAEGESLRGVLGAALMDAGRWDEALAIAADAPPDAPGTAPLWEAAARRLAAEAADPAFLRLAFAEAETLAAAPISAEVTVAIAARLDALGFGAGGEEPEEPMEVAAPTPPPPPAPAPVVAPEPSAGLAGPITSGQRSLQESRRRRADLAQRIEALGLETLEPAASTLR